LVGLGIRRLSHQRRLRAPERESRSLEDSLGGHERAAAADPGSRMRMICNPPAAHRLQQTRRRPGLGRPHLGETERGERDAASPPVPTAGRPRPASGEEEDGLRRASMDRFHAGARLLTPADLGPKVLASVAATARAVPWARSQWQTKE